MSLQSRQPFSRREFMRRTHRLWVRNASVERTGLVALGGRDTESEADGR